MKNVQKPEKIHLGKLIEEIKKGRFVIPDFQREFDWEPWDVRDLIKSIFMDYYIGTLLLWEGNSENYQKLACAPLYAFKRKLDPEYIVLDGQQRLSAMHYAFFQPDVNFRKRKNPFYFFVDLKQLLAENFEDAFSYTSMSKGILEILNSTELQYENHTFPLGMMQEGSWGIDDWIKGYRDYWTDKSEVEQDELKKEVFEKNSKDARSIKEFFSDLLNDYQISYISLDKQLALNKVCDIFTHINSKGKALDTFDLLNSITRKEDIYLKEMYREASKKTDDLTYPGFEIKSQVMMTMSILKQNYCSPKYLYYLVPNEKKRIKKPDGKTEDIVLIKSKQEFIDLWDTAVDSIDRCLKSLKNQREFGAITNKFLPYPSIIPCLSAIKQYVKDSELKGKVDIHSKIKQWYWASIFQNRYSSSVESTSTKDYIDLRKWFEDDNNEPDCVSEFVGTYKNIDLHKETRNGSAIYKAIFDIFILNEARDWETFELPEYDELHDHHIVPKSWGKKMELGQDINTILNRTPLSGNTNRKIIRDSLPNVYIKKMFENNDKEKVYQVLNSHLISRKAVSILLRDNFTVDDFKEFIHERKNTIIDAIYNMFINQKVELPEHLKRLDNEIEDIELSLRQFIIDKLSVVTKEDIKEKIPSNIYDKMTQKINRERKRNPSNVEGNINSGSYWFQFTDLQELQQIITSKIYWDRFSETFGSKDKLTNEFNDMANLRNAIRHSREADQITKMKGEASFLWFKQQLN